ncbi:MAG TPA: GNAT family N-acetyltransferase [Candidatus Desulfovibrio intestinigallinarum]|nr:GNAT family N-acetyltransferase [Candidatus Desulfovibrio intestinigallinarum]
MVIRAAAPADWPALRSLWRRSVAATHDFVSRDDLDAIGRALIPCYFPAMQHIWLATDAAGRPLGFVGSRERSIEMLFLDPDVFRQGIGTALLRHACACLPPPDDAPVRLDVNEANEPALRFYLAQGFVVIGRSPLDGDGRPYPLLHMERR